MDAAAIAAAAAAEPMKVEIPATVPGRVIHIDGDYAAYFCAGNDETAPGIARKTCIERFEGMARRAGAEKIVVHLTAQSSHKGLRYFAATVKPYQAQRSAGRKPKNWRYLRDFLETYDGERFRIKTWHNREADDGIALCAYDAISKGQQAVIATRDKDMRMLPGLHMDWVTQRIDAEVPLHAYSVIGSVTGLQYGYKWLLLQCLQGDTADNIPGLERVVIDGKVKQCGEKTAESLLADAEDLVEAWATVECAYLSYYGAQWRERMAEQLALLYLRHDWNAHLNSWAMNPALNLAADPGLVLQSAALRVRCEKEDEALAQTQSE